MGTLSRRASRWLLFAALVLMAPVPLAVLGPALVPPARILMLGVITVAVMVRESARGAAPSLAAVLLVQVAIYLAAAWLAAGLVSRLLHRIGPAAVGPVTLGLVALGLALACSFEIYDTPFSARAAHASLLDVYR